MARSVSQDRWDQVDPLDHSMMFPAPMTGNQFNLTRIWLVKVPSSITNSPSSCLIIGFASLYNASVFWGCLSNNRLTESWAMGLVSDGKHRDASVHEHVWYVAMRKLMKSLLVHFGGFTRTCSPFRGCPFQNGIS
jgi:hypothetical protein